MAPPDRIKECSGKIVAAHTVPRSYLGKIARAGHVYRIGYKFPHPPNELPVREELIGVGDASTINGFCGFHDDALFAPIEKTPFNATDEQCFLLMYRAVAREAFLKRAALRSLEKRKEILSQRRIGLSGESAEMGGGYEIGTRQGVEDINSYKDEMDKVLQEKAFDQTRSLVIEFEEAPDAMVSGAHFPESDFRGKYLDNHYRLGAAAPRPHLMSFSSLVGQESGFVVLSWLPGSDATCLPLIDSILELTDDQLGNALLRYFCEYCENTYFRPEWWEGLTEMEKAAVVVRLATGGSPRHMRKPDCLVDDGLNLVKWKVRTRSLRKPS